MHFTRRIEPRDPERKRRDDVLLERLHRYVQARRRALGVPLDGRRPEGARDAD